MCDPKPIFSPDKGRKMRIVVLFSGGASAVPLILGSDLFEVVGAVSSSKSASGIEKLKRLGIPVEVVDIKDFYAGRPIRDMNVRKEYEERLIRVIREKGWEPDIIACSGYMYVLTERFLQEFPDRVLNVHPADLSIVEGGRRKYTGLHAVRDQIESGEKETRSTIHLMNGIPDHGPIIVVSGPLPVEGRSPEEQQALMKEKCDGPAYRMALELIARGMVAVDCKKNVYVLRDGRWVKGHVRMGEEG